MERRAFLLSSLMLALAAGRAGASPIDPKETFVLQRDQIKFAPWDGLPPGSGEMASLYGDLNKTGPYLVLMKWNPGWFSAPHSYATDRICMVMSGTWWVNSGADFDPGTPCRSPPAGSSNGKHGHGTMTASPPASTSRWSSRSSALAPWASNWRIRVSPHGAASEKSRRARLPMSVSATGAYRRPPTDLVPNIGHSTAASGPECSVQPLTPAVKGFRRRPGVGVDAGWRAGV